MLAVFAAPEVRVRFVADIVDAAIVNPPMAPLVAVMLPVIVALVAVNAPAAVTRKAAVARLAKVEPAQIAISPPAAGEPRPAAVAPVPTVILAVFAAPDCKSRFVAVIVDAAIVNPAIAPAVAVIVPVIVALVAVRAPAFVTRNGAEPGVAEPAYMAGLVPPESSPTVVAPEPEVSDVAPIVHPPIVPVVAVILPTMVRVPPLVVHFR